MIHLRARGAAALPAAAAMAFLVCACDTIPRAPKGSARVELEVGVEVAPSFTGQLGGVDDSFRQTMASLVAEQADVGLRFYPVLSERYASSDPRPEHLMTVRLENLDYEFEHQAVNNDEPDPEIMTRVKRVRCGVAVQLVKRRDNGPDLVVASTTAQSVAAVKAGEIEGTAYDVPREEEGTEALQVPHDDLVRLVRAGVEEALGELVDAIDRELRQSAAAATP